MRKGARFVVPGTTCYYCLPLTSCISIELKFCTADVHYIYGTYITTAQQIKNNLHVATGWHINLMWSDYISYQLSCLIIKPKQCANENNYKISSSVLKHYITLSFPAVSVNAKLICYICLCNTEWDWNMTNNFEIELISDTRVARTVSVLCLVTWLKRCSRQPCSLSCLSEGILMSHGNSSPSKKKKHILNRNICFFPLYCLQILKQLHPLKCNSSLFM